MSELLSKIESLASKRPTVHIVDDHDEILDVWKDEGLKNRVLIHIDEHSDFQWIQNKKPTDVLNEKSFSDFKSRISNPRGWTTETLINRKTHLGNFLYELIDSGAIRHWFWIFPSPLWEKKSTRAQVWKELSDLYKFRTGKMEPPVKIGDTFQARIFNTHVTVTSIDNLPKIKDPVLLSLDVDYLTADPHDMPAEPKVESRRLPWMWPEDLISILKFKEISISHAVIANSINGGYTPIRFKFIGEELGHLLVDETQSKEYLPLVSALKDRHRGNDEAALKSLMGFTSHGVYEAVRQSEMAQIYYEMGNRKKARECFAEAIKADKDFDTRYQSLAPLYEQFGMHKEAITIHRQMRKIAPDSIYPLLGKAYYLNKDGRFEDAIEEYENVLEIEPDNFHANFFLGGIHLFELKNPEKAMRHYFTAHEACETEPNLFSCLGLCLIELGDYEEAKRYFREALKLGAHSSFNYHYLSLIYRKLKKKKKAFEFSIKSIRLKWLEIYAKLTGSL